MSLDKRVRAMESSSEHLRKVIPELLLEDLAHDDRVLGAVNRVKVNSAGRNVNKACYTSLNLIYWLL